MPSTNTNNITITLGSSNIAGAGFVLSFCSLVIERDFNMSNKHKHYDMIVAKAANMDLVVFGKLQPDSGSAWIEVSFKELTEEHFHDYFLCLPQHKESCLHWLNGGDTQADSGSGEFDDVAPFIDIPHWESSRWFMRHNRDSRIKTKKEKRWVAFTSKGDFISIHETKPSGLGENNQLVEIEVEV